jgi:hypothetical protein
MSIRIELVFHQINISLGKILKLNMLVFILHHITRHNNRKPLLLIV